MYVPPYYAVTEQEEMISFMQQHPVALLISTNGENQQPPTSPWNWREEGKVST